MRQETAIKVYEKYWLMSFFLGLVLWCPYPKVSAGELGAFNEQVVSAYAPYRSAMFYLRTGNPDVAYLELDAALSAWRSLIERFGKSPPDAFADDQGFGDTLVSVQKALETGRALLDKDDQTSAAATLTSVRIELAALRRRNGVHVYSDCIDEMNANIAGIAANWGISVTVRRPIPENTTIC